MSTGIDELLRSDSAGRDLSRNLIAKNSSCNRHYLFLIFDGSLTSRAAPCSLALLAAAYVHVWPQEGCVALV